MTPLQKLERAAEAYVKATETRLRMNRNNSRHKDRHAASKLRMTARAQFEKLVSDHPGEVVKLFRSHRRLQELANLVIKDPTGLSELASKIEAEAKEILP